LAGDESTQTVSKESKPIQGASSPRGDRHLPRFLRSPLARITATRSSLGVETTTEDGPMINATGLQTNAITASISTNPLGRQPLTMGGLPERVDRIRRDPDPDEQRALFRDLEQHARAKGHGAGIDTWEPNLGWLRGDAGP
jgi:hypothetical protein